MKDFYTIYNLEAEDFSTTPTPAPPNWFIWGKVLAIFFLITAVVFLIVNYQSIKKRVEDRRQELQFIKIKDADKDGMDDIWEEKNGFNIKNAADAEEDADGDLLNNRMEFYFGTNPKRVDTDGDGFSDYEEIVKGFNPFGIGRVDSDSDGIYNWWENLFGLDKNDPKDAARDFDADGLTNLEEFKYRTHPKVADSDLDGNFDGIEVQNNINPAGRGALKDASWIKRDDDKDADGLEIIHEVFFGTNQENSDTDDDGVTDSKELLLGRNPKGEGNFSLQLEIPSIEMNLPVLLKDFKGDEDFSAEIGQGAILYPQTAFPGTRGNAYIFGSSGNYKIEGKKMEGEFSRLIEIRTGDLINLKLRFDNGEEKKIVYRAEFQEEVNPKDLRIARDYEGHELTLGTTWPPGADRKILMLKALIYNPSFR
jgi:sortase (surface protein transpeptidase)